MINIYKVFGLHRGPWGRVWGQKKKSPLRLPFVSFKPWPPGLRWKVRATFFSSLLFFVIHRSAHFQGLIVWRIAAQRRFLFPFRQKKCQTQQRQFDRLFLQLVEETMNIKPLRLFVFLILAHFLRQLELLNTCLTGIWQTQLALLSLTNPFIPRRGPQETALCRL